ncbi:MAG: REDY-like protein HapK [Gammaproteobacteria bacterium]
MTTLIVLFRLRAGVDTKAYEAWAKQTDLPVVRQLGSVSDFKLRRVMGLFGSDSSAPYDYVEMIDVTDMPGFVADVSSEEMKGVAAQFREFADNPVFMLSSDVEQG